jgi:hypothetical protein
LRTSLYADDAAIFIAPFKHDVQNLTAILHAFGEVTGLCTNFHKSSVVPICCHNIDLDDILHGTPVLRDTFPLKYLGLPLSPWCLRRADFQSLEDKAARKIPTWNGKLVNFAGRTALVKSVLSSQAIYHFTSLNVPNGTMDNMKKIERAFLWAGTDKVSGGQCKVNWDIVCRPKNLGGLGVLNADFFSRALRLRWPWKEWKEPYKIWVGLGNPCNDTDMDLFYASTTIVVGNGKKTPFWKAPWLNGIKPIDIAPLIYKISTRKNWKVKKAMSNHGWISKINLDAVFTIQHIRQYISLWVKLSEVSLNEDVEDEISWNLTDNGIYSSTSAYHAQFFGATLSPVASSVW